MILACRKGTTTLEEFDESFDITAWQMINLASRFPARGQVEHKRRAM